jgi:SET domain-containing protein 6
MAVSAATGRCVVATKDIKQGEVVVEVPDDAVLMGENCRIQEMLAGRWVETNPRDKQGLLGV